VTGGLVGCGKSHGWVGIAANHVDSQTYDSPEGVHHRCVPLSYHVPAIAMQCRYRNLRHLLEAWLSSSTFELADVCCYKTHSEVLPH
jgi:hypothetical protein